MKQFVQDLVASGLMTAQQVRAFVEGLPENERPTTRKQLARLLVKKGKLTRFQAEMIYLHKPNGLVLDKYVLLEKLGAGGMGVVFLAEHRLMRRRVALKILPPKYTRSTARLRRFHREVEAAAKLKHPNIVTAYDASEAKGVHFLVCEYIEGRDLAKYVAEVGPLDIAEAVDYCRQAAEGLRYAHQTGVVHRDIKPSNLLLENSGTVKILDMGLARIDYGSSDDEPVTGEDLTSTGTVMGTVDYMSPEQAGGQRQIDRRADIYSLGCTLYFLLTGEPPTQGRNVGEKLGWHLHGPIPSLRGAVPGVPEALDRVAQKMLARRREERYQEIGEVIADLERVVSGLEARGGDAPSGQGSSRVSLQEFLSDLRRKRSRGANAGVGPANDDEFDFDRSSADVPGVPAKPVWNRRLWGGVGGGVATLAAVLLVWWATAGGGSQGPSGDGKALVQRGPGRNSPPGSSGTGQAGNGPSPFLPPQVQWNMDVYELVDEYISDGMSGYHGRDLYSDLATSVEQRLPGEWYIGPAFTKDEAYYRFQWDNRKLQATRLRPNDVAALKLNPYSWKSQLAAGFDLPLHDIATLSQPDLVLVETLGPEMELQRYVVGGVALQLPQDQVIEDLTLMYEGPQRGQETIGVLNCRLPAEGLRSNLTFPAMFTVVNPDTDLTQQGRLYLKGFFRAATTATPRPAFYRVSKYLAASVRPPRWDAEVFNIAKEVLSPHHDERTDVFRSLYGEVAITREANEDGVWYVGSGLTQSGMAMVVTLRRGTVTAQPMSEAAAAAVPVGVQQLTSNSPNAVARPPLQKMGLLKDAQLRLVKDPITDVRRVVGHVQVERTVRQHVGNLALVVVSIEAGDVFVAFQVLQQHGVVPDETVKVEIELAKEAKPGGELYLQLRGFVYWPRPGLRRLADDLNCTLE